MCNLPKEKVRMLGKGAGIWERSQVWGERGPPVERERERVNNSEKQTTVKQERSEAD